MLRSRCFLRSSLSGCAPHGTFLRHTRGVVLTRNITPVQVYPTQPTSHSLASFATRTDGDAARAQQRATSTVHPDVNENHPSSADGMMNVEERYTRQYTHENVFSNRATAALNSLFEKSGLASADTAKNTTAARSEEHTHLTGGETTEITEALACAAFAAHDSSEIEGGGTTVADEHLVSHGEEEVEEQRIQFAQDLEDPTQATPSENQDLQAKQVHAERQLHTDSTSLSGQQSTEQMFTTQHQNQQQQQQPQRGRGGAESTKTDPQSPINLQGASYGGEMAAALQAASLAHHFLSPFWSPRAAYAQIGAAVEVPEAEGVLLHLSTDRPVTFFNLEQTSLAEQFRAATVHEVRAYILNHRSTANGHASNASLRPLGARAMNVAGGLLSRERAASLAASPHFFEWQDRCPYWISEEEVAAIGATVRPDEVNNFHPVTYTRSGYASPPPVTSEMEEYTHYTSSPNKEEQQQPQQQGDRVRQRMYNLLQLEDEQHRFHQFGVPPEKLARCYGIRGTRYSPATTWLMWEYCRRFHFPLMGHCIVMLTAERVHAMGGSIVETRRYPLPPLNLATPRGAPAVTPTSAAEVAGSQERSDATLLAAHGAAVEGDAAAADAVEGVIPPPFTLLINDEVVTLFNALQTDIPEAIFERMERQRENRYKTPSFK